MGLYGTVKNLGGNAEIVISASDRVSEEFLRRLVCLLPESALIDSVEISDTDEPIKGDFKIIESRPDRLVMPEIIPDVATCEDCIDELFDENVVKVVFDKNGKAMYFSRQTIPFLRKADKNAKSWMEQRTFYKHIGIYAYKVDVLMQIAKLPQSGLELSECLEQLRWLENSYEIKMGITEFESYSIDTPQDVEKCLKFFKD